MPLELFWAQLRDSDLQSQAAGLTGVQLEELFWAESKPLVAKLGLSIFLS